MGLLALLITDPSTTRFQGADQPTTPGSSGTTSTTIAPAAGGGFDPGDEGADDADLQARVSLFRYQVAQGGAPDLAQISDATAVEESVTGEGGRYSRSGPRLTTRRRTIGALLDDLSRWDEAEIRAMQTALWEAGYYPASYYSGSTDRVPEDIADGVSDADLRSAYALLLSDAVLADGKPIERILAERRRDFAATGRLARGGKVRPPEFSGGTTHEIMLDSPASLDAMIEDISVQATGAAADPKFKAALIQRLRAQDRADQERVINASEAQRRANFDAGVAQAEAHGMDRGITPESITSEQRAIAETIIQEGQALGMPLEAITAAVATGMFESRLTNHPGGDRDSEGVFQQRPSQGWTGLQDVAAAAREFYEHYQRAEGATPAEKAANVQRPAAQYRQGYAANMTNAAAVVGSITGQTVDAAGLGTAGGDVLVPSSTVVADRFDPRAEAEAAVKANDPAGYGAHQVVGQYRSFQQFLHRGQA